MDEEKLLGPMRINLMGIFIYYCFPVIKAIMKKNIDIVYKNTIKIAEKKRLMIAFYSHIVTSIKEMFCLRFMSEKQLCGRVSVKGVERLLAIAEAGRGVLVLTGHFGNWEFAPLGGILNFKQFHGQFHFIRRTLGGKTLERILFRRYYQAGLNVILKKNALQQVCDVLDKNHAVVFVLDQHSSLKNREGIAVEFFGEKAGTYRSLSSLAQYTGVPVVPAAGYRLKDGRHVLEFFEPIMWHDHGTTQESMYHNTLAYNQALERIILMYPEQWLWIHNRWKLAL